MDYTWITYTYTYIQRIYLKNIKNKYINSVYMCDKRYNTYTTHSSNYIHTYNLYRFITIYADLWMGSLDILTY